MENRVRRGCLVICLLLASAGSVAETGTATQNASLEDVLDKLARQQQALDRQQRGLARQQQELNALKTQLLREREQNRDIANKQRNDKPERSLAAENDDVSVTASASKHIDSVRHDLEFSGYGIVNYFNRDWETDEFAKDGFDTERFIFELEYQFNERWSAKAELEYEHGGTGATLELDTQEEFGEFEQEIEKGGEILVEELYVAYRFDDWLNAKFGRFYVPVGRTSKYHKPQDYFTVARSDADAALLPQLWHENGIAIFGDWHGFHYEAQIVNGLDSTGFSSRNWIAGGHQKRFEEARAEDLAFVGRIDYRPWPGLQLGASYYGGDSRNNRPKDDLNEDAFVDIIGLDAQWKPGAFTIRGQYLWGRLQNSHLVTEANRNLSNNLGVKRTPVGSEARSWYLEAGYDFLAGSSQDLILFGRYDDYDSMDETEGLVFDNPRWHRESWTVGLNYLPLSRIVFKAEYNQRSLDIDANDEENTFALGVGFTY